MATETLAGSKKPFWSAGTRRNVIECLTGKALNLRQAYEGQTLEQIQKVRFGSFSRGAERAASDLLRVGDLLMLVFGRRRQWLHRRRRDIKRNRIACNVFDGAESRFLFSGCMTAQA